MKLARTLVMAMAVALIGLCAGCTPNIKPLTPAQIASIACPQLNLAHSQLVLLNTALEADPATAAIGAKAAAQLAAIQPIVAAVCNGAEAAPAVDTSSIQALIQTGLPALGYLAGSLPLPADQQAQIQAALVIAETAVGVVGVVEQQVKAAHAASASSPTVQPPLL